VVLHSRRDGCAGVTVTVMRVKNFERQRTPAKAVETDMKTSELQSVLGYLNIGLAIAHNTGVTGGHFGNTDFIGLAETVNRLFLNAITPTGSNAPTVGIATSTVVSTPVPENL
jgi:hypothetical protein